MTYEIKIKNEFDSLLERLSKKHNMSQEDYLQHILNLILESTHKMNYDSIACGYREMGELNLKLSENIIDD